MDDIEEKLKNAIKKQPIRYIVYKNTEGELVEVQDRDTGIIWRKYADGWGHIQ